MSYHVVLFVLSLIALIPVLSVSSTSSSSSPSFPSSSAVSGNQVIARHTHKFAVNNSVEEGSSLEVKCFCWGAKIVDRRVPYEEEVSWASKISADAVHCTCTVCFPKELAQKLGTKYTEFDVIHSKKIKDGVQKTTQSGHVAYFWRWFLQEDGIHFYDFDEQGKRFVKGYKSDDPADDEPEKCCFQ